MLQHNALASGRRAHLVHAAVMGVHAICCGLPALALAAASLSGATVGFTLLSENVAEIHHFLHDHEVWVLALSAVLVVTGGALEASSRRTRVGAGVPWLFAFSVLCFVVNLGIILAHRG